MSVFTLFWVFVWPDCLFCWFLFTVVLCLGFWVCLCLALFEFSDLLMYCSLLLLLVTRELFVFISGFWFLGCCGV